jgi:hypothetical protein
MGHAYCSEKCLNHAAAMYEIHNPDSTVIDMATQAVRRMKNMDHGLMQRLRDFANMPLIGTSFEKHKQRILKMHRKEYLKQLALLGSCYAFNNQDEQHDYHLELRDIKLFPPFEDELTTMLQNMGIL